PEKGQAFELGGEVRVEAAQSFAYARVLAEDAFGRARQRVVANSITRALRQKTGGGSERSQSEAAGRTRKVLGQAPGLIPILFAGRRRQRFGEAFRGVEIGLQNVDQCLYTAEGLAEALSA